MLSTYHRVYCDESVPYILYLKEQSLPKELVQIIIRLWCLVSDILSGPVIVFLHNDFSFQSLKLYKAWRNSYRNDKESIAWCNGYRNKKEHIPCVPQNLSQKYTNLRFCNIVTDGSTSRIDNLGLHAYHDDQRYTIEEKIRCIDILEIYERWESTILFIPNVIWKYINSDLAHGFSGYIPEILIYNGYYHNGEVDYRTKYNLQEMSHWFTWLDECFNSKEYTSLVYIV